MNDVANLGSFAGVDERCRGIGYMCVVQWTARTAAQETEEWLMSDRSSAACFPWFRATAAWRLIGLRFFPVLAVLSLLWEVVHLPLFTIWREGNPEKLAFAVVHCTLGDIAIGISALLLALIVVRAGAPRTWPRVKLIAAATALAVVYTIFSEWINTSLLESWGYSSRMPVLPFTGTGLSPFLQWLVIVPLTLILSLRGLRDERDSG